MDKNSPSLIFIFILYSNSLFITWDFPCLQLILRNHSNVFLDILRILFHILSFYFPHLFVPYFFYLLHQFLILVLILCFPVLFSSVRDQLLIFLNLLYRAQLTIICAWRMSLSFDKEFNRLQLSSWFHRAHVIIANHVLVHLM